MTINVSQEDCVRLLNKWPITCTPEYRAYICADCGKNIRKAWHIHCLDGGYKREFHLCKECGKEHEEMTRQERILLHFDDLLKRLGLDYMIFASSLLHIIREGKLYEPDVEIDLAFHGDDLTEDIMAKLQASGHFGALYPCHEKYGEFYLWDVVGEPTGNPHIAMNPVWKKSGMVYMNMNGDDCMLWDPKFYPKESWSTIEYLGRKFNVPGKPKEYLEYWFGPDWETPLAGTWRDNKNRKQWKELWV